MSDVPNIASQFTKTFHSPTPAAFQSFANSGNPPYGQLIQTRNPEILVQNPTLYTGQQPVYHVKVTATPVQVPNQPNGPEYTVSAFPNSQGGKESLIVGPSGKVITHAAPDVSRQTQGVSIHPTHYDELPAHEPEYFRGRLDETGNPVTNQAEMTDKERCLVTVARCKEDLMSNSFIPGLDESLISMMQNQKTVPSMSNALPGTTPLETGYSRPIPSGLHGLEEAENSKGKMYSWIVPSGAKIRENPPLQQSPSFDMSEEEDDEHFNRVFAQASMALEAQDSEDLMGTMTMDKQYISTPTDDELGLPKELRPSVVYGGIEQAPPEFAGYKGRLNYKLHAIEVHQYIDLPETQKPWIMTNNVNPATTSIFGHMPLPFDPAHTGFVAPTFQRTAGRQPTPVLSPELSRMFNHELPSLSHQFDSPRGSQQSEHVV